MTSPPPLPVVVVSVVAGAAVVSVAATVVSVPDAPLSTASADVRKATYVGAWALSRALTMALGSSVAAKVLSTLVAVSPDPARAVVVVTTAAVVVISWPAVGLASARAVAPAVVLAPAATEVATRRESEATSTPELERAIP